MAADEEDNLEVDETSLDPEESGASGKPAGEKPEAKKGKEDRESAKETASLKARIKELEESERHWAEIAKRGARQEAEPEDEEPEPEDEEPADETPEKFTDDLSSKGLKALVDRGVLTKKAAREIIEREARKIAREVVATERQKMTSDGVIVRDFPDLQNKGSELWKLTRAKLARAVELDGPEAAKSAATVYACAEAAKAELALKNGKNGKGRREPEAEDLDLDTEEPDEREDEDERDRRRRVREQSGGRDRRPADEDEGTLGPEAREMVKLMGISQDGFRAQRKALGKQYRRAR